MSSVLTKLGASEERIALVFRLSHIKSSQDKVNIMSLINQLSLQLRGEEIDFDYNDLLAMLKRAEYQNDQRITCYVDSDRTIAFQFV